MNEIKQFISSFVTHEKTPLALSVVSCTGVVATAILAAKAAPKASYLLSELREKNVDTEGNNIPLTPTDIFKTTWKLYAPAVAVGGVTIMSIVAMKTVSERNAVLLTAGATLATNTLKEYQQHILEEIGSERESKVRDRIARATVERDSLPDNDSDIFIVNEGEILCYDKMSGRYFKHDVEEIRRIENELNKEILTEMYMPLNAVYDALGLEPIELGEILGYNTDNMIDFHFSSQLTPQKRPVLVLSHINMPIPDYDR